MIINKYKQWQYSLNVHAQQGNIRLQIREIKNLSYVKIKMVQGYIYIELLLIHFINMLNIKNIN